MTLLRKELRFLLRRPSSYGIMGLVLFIQGVIFYYYATNIGPEYSAVLLETFFEVATPMTIFGAVLLSVRSLSDEYKQGSIRLLQASPITDLTIVLAKVCALWFLSWLMTLLSVYLPAYIYAIGQVSIGHIVAGYTGLCLVGMMTVSVSLLFSSLTDKQFLAGALTGAVLSLSYLMQRFTGLVSTSLGDFLSALSFKSHLRSQYGLIVYSDIAYYIACVVVSLAVATDALHRRRLYR